MLTTRELPATEWHKLTTIPPFDQGLPDPAHWRILGVEEDGEIVGICGASDQVHWDPWWIAPDHQGKVGVFRQLVEAGIQMFQTSAVAGVHLTVPNDRPDLQELVERFGFVEAPGKLYLFEIPKER